MTTYFYGRNSDLESFDKKSSINTQLSKAKSYANIKNLTIDVEIFEQIREIGQEFGATTGRPRQINWLDYDMLKMASKINGITKLVVNKMDVLEKVDSWCLYDGPNLYEFKTRNDIEMWLEAKIELEVDDDIEVMFSGDKEFI